MVLQTMIATQQKVKGRRGKYNIGMKTDWVTHINTWNITFVFYHDRSLSLTHCEVL